jgi:glycosyltransferase involved in cell wall biosynthesis
VPVENMPIRSFYGWSMLRRGLQFVRYVREARADIVHAHDVYSNIFTAVWAPMARVPVLITSRRWWNALPNRKLAVGSRFAVARSTAILANSQAVAGLVASESPSARERIRTVTNFVDEAAFGGASERERARLWRDWGVPSDAVVIGCVARFDPLKNHLGLLQAFSLVHAREPRAHLVLIGDGELRSKVAAEARLHGLEDAVHFVGEIRSPENLHRGFDISVLASLSEGFPNVIVEAMAAGKPVVATAVGGSVDAVVHEKTGLLVAPADVEQLASAIVRLVQQSELRRTFGAAGEVRARELYSASRVLDRLGKVYAELVESR